MNSLPPDARRQARTASMGMWLLIASLGMLFAATLVLYLVFRLTAAQWPPPGQPPLPIAWLSLSTVLLLLSGGTIQYAQVCARRDRIRQLQASLTLTLLLALAFLASQIMAWSVLLQAKVYLHGNIYAGTFYLLTVLHALHTLGGLAALVNIVTQSYRRRLGAGNWLPVKSVVMYWHFLDAVWVIIFVVLLLGG
jgi:cytochrome c oxidase subunit III